jgi:hypothetical protein
MRSEPALDRPFPPAHNRSAMTSGDALRKNLEFWHWYPRMLCEGLTEEQLYWQPEHNNNHIMFAIWHAFRSEDDIIHSLLIQRPGVFASEGWAERLPVAEPGRPPFGTGLNREQIAAVRVDLETLLEYAEAVRTSIQDYADSLAEEQANEEIPLPFFADVYPMLDRASRMDVLNFFCIGHVAEHLGEVQYVKGLLGLTGAPL